MIKFSFITLIFFAMLLTPLLTHAQPYGSNLSASLRGARHPTHFCYSTLRRELNRTRQYPAPQTSSVSRRVQKRTSGITSIIDVQLNITDASCGYGNGSLVAVASGGVAPYRYELTSLYSTSHYNTGNIQPLGAGDYKLRVIDANGDFVITPFNVNNIYPEVKLELDSYVPASACSAMDGSITVKASGGLPPYQYSWDRANYSSNNTFTGLSYGGYDFFVKDANGCVGIYDNFPIIGNFGCDNPLEVAGGGATCGNGSVINLRNTGGNGPYTYSLDGVNYQADGYWDNIGPGFYTVWSKDKDGKLVLFSLNVIEWCDIVITYIGVDAACKQEDGVLTLTAQNGVPPYAYSIDGVNYQSSNTFSNLAPGHYIITARDFNNIKNSVSADVYDKCPWVNLSVTKESCTGNDGSIQIYGYKGTEPYEYSIDGQNFQSATGFTGLKEGNYTITIRDALGFTGTKDVYVAKGCLNVVALGEDAGCQGGKIKVSVYGGAEPYQFSLNGASYQSGSVFEQLSAGIYIVRVKDADGLEGTAEVVINSAQSMQLDINAVRAGCSLNDGEIRLQATGGSAPFTYSLDGINFQANGTFTNLVAGNVSAWVKDATGCILRKDTTLTVNCLAVETRLVAANCNETNGEITVRATNGIAPYEFSIDGTNFLLDSVFSGLAPGLYTVKVRATDGSVQTKEVEIKETCLLIRGVVQNAVCGLGNGKVVLSVSGGTSPYQYSLDGINFDDSNEINLLSKGDYFIFIKDATGIIADTVFKIGEDPFPKLDFESHPATCLNNDGQVKLRTTDVTFPVLFNRDGAGFQTDSVFNGLPAGQSTFTLKDARGCILSSNIIVDSVENLYLNAGVDTTICEGVSVRLQPLSNATSYTWNSSSSLNNANTKSPVAAPAVTTTYELTGKLGVCTSSDIVEITVHKAPMPEVSDAITICYGQSTALHGSGGQEYIWSPATYLDNAHVSNPVVSNATSSITYQLTVVDEFGCVSLLPASVAVSVTPLPKLFAGNDTAVVTNKPLQLYATDVNNSGFVQYTWSPNYGFNDANSATPVATPDRDVVYTVKAKTLAGCEASDQISVKVYQRAEIYVANVFTPDGNNKNDVLKAKPIGINQFKYFQIFDRWGKKIFYSASPATGWDGFSGGKKNNSGSFVWMAMGIDFEGKPIFRKGVVTIIQ